jgi:ComF family protein
MAGTNKKYFKSPRFDMLSKIVQPVKDFLFSTACFHCGGRLLEGEKRVCAQCWGALTPVRKGDHTYSVLRQRFTEGAVIDDVVSLYYFEKGKLLQSLAHSLKYGEVTAFGFELGVKLGYALEERAVDAVIPVPLNKRKERERGYNQSDWIGRGVSSVTGIPVWSDVVRRVRYTVTQTHLNAEQRKENIAEAFDIIDAHRIKDKRLLIVDDIITTGSTIQEVARLLRAAGAVSVIAGSAGLAKLGEDA